MVRQPQSIDGFVRRPSRASLKAQADQHGVAGAVRRPVRTADMVTHSARRQPQSVQSGSMSRSNQPKTSANKSSIGSAEEQLLNDIESSLNQIGDLTPPEEVTGRHQRRAARKLNAQQAKKKKLTKKKIIKRIVILIILILIGIVGYLAVKAMLAGGKVFNGNPLTMLTTKTRLAEDSNGRTNILIFGTSGYSMDENAWDGAMLTDSIMVLSIDQDKHDAYMISLPRDLYVKHSCPALGTTSGKLNETFYCAYSANKDEKAGAQALMKKTGEILGLEEQYYVHADWTALIQLVDAVGGVDVTIESTDPRGIYDSGTKLRYKNGEVAHLDGQKALALARARNHNYGDYGLAGGNYDREKNQQKILAALQQKALSAGTLANPATVNNMIDALGNNLITNFEAGHVQTLMDIASDMKADQIKQLPLVGRKDGGPDLVGSYSAGGQYLGEAPVAGPFDYADIQAYIAKNLSNDPVIKEAAVIDVLNGSGQVGLAAEESEKLEDDHYTIGEVANAPAVISDKVVVYQRNADKSGTAKALEKKLGVKVVQGDLAGYQTTADFVIVYGAGSVSEQ